MKLLSTLLFSLLFFIAAAQPPDADGIRSMIADGVKQLAVPAEAVASVENQTIGTGTDTFGIRIYRPVLNKKLPVVYFIHGGAWVAGDVDTHDNICRYLANRLQALVVSVNYRRPPEFKFPVLYNDANAGLQWLANNRKKLRAGKKLVLVGDSGGGTLVAGLVMENRRSERPLKINAQALINPALNLSKGSPTDQNYGMLLPMILSPTDSATDLRISPLLATDFSRLPPAFIVAGEKDEIRADAEQYHAKLLQAGVRSVLFVQPGEGHLGPHFAAAGHKARPAMEFLVKHLQPILKD